MNAQSFPSTLELCRVRRWQGDAAAEGRAEEEDAEDKAALQVADSLRLNRHPPLPALPPLFVRCKSPSSFPPPFPPPPPRGRLTRPPRSCAASTPSRSGAATTATLPSRSRAAPAPCPIVGEAVRGRVVRGGGRPYSKGSGTGKGCERGREGAPRRSPARSLHAPLPVRRVRLVRGEGRGVST